MKTTLDDEDTELHVKQPLSENTSVRVGLVVAFLGLCAGGFGLWIWWASAINTKLDTVISQQAAQLAETKSIRTDVDELKAWRKLVDAYGSPVLSAKVDGLEKHVDAMANELDLHKKLDDKYRSNPMIK